MKIFATNGKSFQDVFGSNTTFVMGLAGAVGECKNITGGGCTSDSDDPWVNFVDPMAGDRDGLSFNKSFPRNRNNIIHELGHVLNRIHGMAIGGAVDYVILSNSNMGRRPEAYSYGFASNFGVFEWQMSANPPDNLHNAESGSEVFADMFLAWTYKTWYNGDEEKYSAMAVDKSLWMTDNIGKWITP